MSAAGTVSVISTASGAVVATITVGTDPSQAVVNGDRTVLYVTNRGSDNVSVIDTADNSVTATVAVEVPPLPSLIV